LILGIVGPIACVEPKAELPSPAAGQYAMTDQPLFELTGPLTTQAAATPEPKVIEDGDKSTLVYTCRSARPETLKESIEGLISPEGSVQASPSLNSLVVKDTKDVVRGILAVLKEIDRPVNQLLVEARVVEVTLDTDLEYEIRHLLTINSDNPGSAVQTSDLTLKTPGATPTEGQGVSINIRPWRNDGKMIDDFFRLLLTKNKAKILSSPNLLVSAGNEASIITGEEVPIQSTQVVAGSLSTNTQFKRVGIKLRVQLQQITNDTARIEINPEVSTVTGYTASGPQSVSNPIVAIRNVSSTLSMKDGEILTVGGLLRDEDRQTVRGVPGLMDVPGLGLLFQSKRNQTVRSQLIFFLRIRIVPEGAVRTTRVHRPGAGMEDIENRTGVVVQDPTTRPANPGDGKK
jgi:type II secretory pathway component GspD/PulD (secretin)